MDGSTITAVIVNGVSLDCPGAELQQTKVDRLPFDTVSPRSSDAAVRQTVSMPNIKAQRLVSVRTPQGPHTQLTLRSLTLRQHVQLAILTYGIDGAWERITDLAVDNARPVSGVPVFKIHAIVNEHGHKALSNLRVLIGNNYVPLTLLARCSIGCMALSDLFTQKTDTGNVRLRKSTIRQTLKSLELGPLGNPFEVTRLGNGVVLSWNFEGSNQEFYSRDSLVGALLDSVRAIYPTEDASTSTLPVIPERPGLHPHYSRPILPVTSDNPQTLRHPTISGTGDSPAPEPYSTPVGDSGTEKSDAGQDAWCTRDLQSVDQCLNTELKSRMSFDNDEIERGTLSWIRRTLCCF